MISKSSITYVAQPAGEIHKLKLESRYIKPACFHDVWIGAYKYLKIVQIIL